MEQFKLVSKYSPMGDQPAAIQQLMEYVLEKRNRFYWEEREQEKHLLFLMLLLR